MNIESALDPRSLDPEYDRLLSDVRDAVLNGRKPPAQPRPIIAESWRRMRRLGVSHDLIPRPDAGSLGIPTEPDVVSAAALLEGRVPLPNDISLTAFVPMLHQELTPMLDENVVLLVLSDRDGHIIWREGGRALTREADGLGFRVGDSWTERAVGTNAIGTSLIERVPVQVHGAEHYCQNQQYWSCAGAPVTDVRTGRPIGVIDLSTAANKSHPALLSLASSLATQVQFAIRQAHLSELDRLRSRNWVGASRLDGRWIVVDAYGWVALSHGVVPPRMVTLPDGFDGGGVMIPEIGVADALPIPGGFVLRLDAAQDGAAIQLTLQRSETGDDILVVERGEGLWTHRLTRRQADIVAAIAGHPEGLSAAQIARDLYGTERSEVAVRSELSRMRRTVGGFITARPYRFIVPITVTAAPAAA